MTEDELQSGPMADDYARWRADSRARVPDARRTSTRRWHGRLRSWTSTPTEPAPRYVVSHGSLTRLMVSSYFLGGPPPAAPAPVVGQLPDGGGRVARRRSRLQRDPAVAHRLQRPSASMPDVLVRSRWIGVIAILPSAIARKSVPGSSWWRRRRRCGSGGAQYRRRPPVLQRVRVDALAQPAHRHPVGLRRAARSRSAPVPMVIRARSHAPPTRPGSRQPARSRRRADGSRSPMRWAPPGRSRCLDTQGHRRPPPRCPSR